MSREEVSVSRQDLPLSIETVNEELIPISNQLSFSATLSSSFVAPDELEDSTDDLTLSKLNISDKKKQRLGKNTDEHQRKRKDTTNSITSFFHRFTRSDKDDKKIVEEEEDEAEDEEDIERPDKLLSPESEDKWFEPREIGYEDSDLGKYGIGYEWDPTNMNETIVLEPLSHESENVIFEEKGMLQLLEDFRNGEMRWLAEPQIGAMCQVKDAHEDITNIHLQIFQIEEEKRKRNAGNDFFSDSDSEEEERIERLFERINSNMVSMHSVLDTVPFYDASKNRVNSDNQPDDEYFSS